MTEKQIREKMERLLKTETDEKKRKDLGHKIFQEYLEGKEEILSALVADFVKYTHFAVLTKRDSIEGKVRAVQRESRRIDKKYQEQGMLFMECESEAGYIPLEIPFETGKDFLTAFSENLDAEEERYNLFKAWLFSYVVYARIRPTYMLCISENQWKVINEKVPNFAKRLKAEGKTYYAKNYFEEKQRIQEISGFLNSTLTSMTEEELNKPEELVKDGNRVKIVDKM